MKLESVSRYDSARYPTLADRVASRARGPVWSRRALALAVAALAAVLGGCLPSAA